MEPEDPRHGTANGYGNLKCRCEACTEAWRVHHYNWMHAKKERLARQAALERKARIAGRRSNYNRLRGKA